MAELKDLIKKDIWDQTLGLMILQAMDDDGDFYRAVNRMYLRWLSNCSEEIGNPTTYSIKYVATSFGISKGMDDALTDITGYCFKSYEKACRTGRKIGYQEREEEE